MKKNSQKFRRGESLVEVIMAIFVVALGASVATSLIISALQSNEFSRDNLIALNLAAEGIEAMRSIRDANWLKFSYDKQNCWNMMPNVTNCQDPAATTIAATNSTTNYTVDLGLNKNLYDWGLAPVSSILNLNMPGTGSDPFQLWYYDIDSSDGSGSHDMLASLSAAGGTKNGSSSFYRMIQVSYPTSGPSSCDPATGKSCEEMAVTSTVQWRAQGVVHQVVLNTELTDYQKIKVKS